MVPEMWVGRPLGGIDYLGTVTDALTIAGVKNEIGNFVLWPVDRKPVRQPGVVLEASASSA